MSVMSQRNRGKGWVVMMASAVDNVVYNLWITLRNRFNLSSKKIYHVKLRFQKNGGGLKPWSDLTPNDRGNHIFTPANLKV